MKCLECLAAGDARERTEGSWGTALPRVTGEGLTEDREEEREPAMWIAVKWLFSRGLAYWGTRERPVWLERGGGGGERGKGRERGGQGEEGGHWCRALCEPWGGLGLLLQRRQES